MAYRVTTDSRNIARASPRRGRERSPLTRNALIAGAALACVAAVAATTALLRSGDILGAPDHLVARRSMLIVALVDPAPPVIARRDPRVPIETPVAPTGVRSSALLPSPPRAEIIAAQAQSAPSQIALVALAPAHPDPAELATPPAPSPAARQTPLFRPEHAAIPLPRRRVALANAASDPETTGSLGPAPRERAIVVARPARPLTPHDKLYGPVRVAALTPSMTVRDDGSDASAALPHAPYDRRTAVYVLADRKVYLPDGDALEAHSGLGDKMDDPRFVSVRMRGATPPHVYDMALRESLFHGVQAIRLKPLGEARAIFNREGLLAHPYMLGPSGQSNGCVSFRDYDRFLAAFRAGKVTRLAVIARLD